MTPDNDFNDQNQNEPHIPHEGAPYAPQPDVSANGRGAYPEPPVDWRSNSDYPADAGQPGQPDFSNPAQHSTDSQYQQSYYLPPSQQQPNAPGQNPSNPFAQGMMMMSGLTEQEVADYSGARRLITVAQLSALVSLLFGGVALSAISIGIAVYGYTKLSKIAAGHEDDAILQGLIRRPGALAIIMAVFALALNIISLIAVYPMIMEALQQGDVSSFFQSSPTPSTSPSSPGDSLWG